MNCIRLFLPLAVCAILNLPAHAELRTAAIFGDNMVLQREQTVPIWGWATPGAEVTVAFADQVRTTHAGTDGRWIVKLGRMKATFAPQTMFLTEGKLPASAPATNAVNGTLSFTNILVGEVWLASGQSNMEKPIGRQPGQKPVFNAEEELAGADKFPSIRLFKIEKTLAEKPLEDLKKHQGWTGCGSNAMNTLSFSAAAYFFGQRIHTNLDVPVGLIESSWGGTRIEPWTPPAGFEKVASQKKFATTRLVVEGTNKLASTMPTAIYNAMIAPVAGFAIRGAIWYQGESNLMGTNAGNDYLEYTDKMTALVEGWREVWAQGDFPFYFVQIAPFLYHDGKTRRVNSPEMLPEFWVLQSKAARVIKKTGMVVTTDLVDNLDDIHPRNKKDVGYRLALLALDKTYDRNLPSESPVYEKIKVSGDKAVVKFKEVAEGLKSRDGQPLTWFEIAGADGRFVAANATIAGRDKVEVSAAGVPSPKAVRFAWHEKAQPNLCNSAGLPAEPFRTDGPGE